MKKLLLILGLVLLLMCNIAIGQHYTDWTGFEFAPRKYDSHGRIVFYELQKDYTISLPEYFIDPVKLPDCCENKAGFYRDWAQQLTPCDWDFFRLEEAGMLTIKKGYRWDGASYLCKKLLPGWGYCPDEHHNFRSSLVHDVIYDLMRMGYLQADHHHQVEVDGTCVDTHILWNDGDHNRRFADMIHYMIGIEDTDPKDDAQSDYFWLRVWGACATHDDDKLCGWKYHASELTAYASDGKVELEWRRPNESGKDPDFDGHFSPWNGYSIRRNGQEIATVEAIHWDFPNPPVFITSYTDNSVINGNYYEYQIIPLEANKNQDDWSNIDIVVPVDGPGNALKLDGIDDYLEANTVSNDLVSKLVGNPFPHSYTFEAWVYPEEQTVQAVIMAFNTMTGGNYNLLSYDGSLHKFCYYDDNNGYIYGSDEFSSGNWYHVAVTVNGNDGILYVNGTQQATFDNPKRSAQGALFSIGQEWDNSATSQHFKGLIDEVRIWRNVARTPAEIQASMYIPLRGDEAGLVALWHFDEPSNFKLAWESTTNANNGYLSGYQNEENPFVPSGAMVENVEIFIDIKPGSCPNPLNAKNKTGNGKSVLPVAILGTEDFDVSDIDPQTITLAGVGPVRWNYEDVGTPTDKSEDSCACVEDESDGYEDLALKFSRQAIIEAIMNGSGASKNNPDGKRLDDDQNDVKTIRAQIVLTLTGELTDGAGIEGYDCVLLMTIDTPTVSLAGGISFKATLLGNRPNPFNPSTTIEFTLPRAEFVKLEIFNILGEKVETLLSQQLSAGSHSVIWDATDAPSGVYFYKIEAGAFSETKKMTLVK